MDFLNDNHIRTLPWPTLSPDLNPIEHLWDEFGRRVRNGLNPPETLDELRWALTQEWNNIPQAFIRNLIGSMRRRCQAVINAREDTHVINTVKLVFDIIIFSFVENDKFC